MFKKIQVEKIGEEVEESLKARRKRIKNDKPKKLDIYKLIWIFVIGCLLGDVIETVFCFFKMGYWMSRSSLIYGPFSVVWGIGAVLLTITLNKLVGKRDLYIFLCGTIVGGVYEYVCSLATEYFLGSTFWDYSDYAFNINGRVNLLYCIFWGLLALMWVQDIYPWLYKKIHRILNKVGKTATIVVMVVMLADMVISAAALSRAAKRVKGEAPANGVERFLDKHYDDARIKKVYPKIVFSDDAII